MKIFTVIQNFKVLPAVFV